MTSTDKEELLKKLLKARDEMRQGKKGAEERLKRLLKKTHELPDEEHREIREQLVTVNEIDPEDGGN